MKKLLILSAAVITAAVSQAASITWGAMNVKTPAAADVTVDQTGITGSGATMANLAINLYWVNKAGEDVFIGTFNTGTGSNAGKSLNNVLGNGTTSELYLAMTADQGNTWKPVYHMTATYATDDGVYSFDGTVTAAAAIGDLASKAVSATANFGSIAGWSYKAKSTDDVPEPTSGLLALLGMAALALKRKRA